MEFTKEEFDIMIDEMLNREQCCKDMLTVILDKTLDKFIKSWCYKAKIKYNIDLSEDAKTYIYIHFYETVIPKFLLKNGINGPVNYDPEGFSHWLCRVAKRTFINFMKEELLFSSRVISTDDELLKFITAEVIGLEKNLDEAETRQRLRKIFSIVINLRMSIYKKLTWLLEFLLIINHNSKKIEANRIMEKVFSDKSLFSMYCTVLVLIENIPWLSITEEEKAVLIAGLEKSYDENQKYADVKYSEFYMKKGPISSISDWINRVNDMIKKELKK
ncbi:MAG: hypothetical protein E7591_05490 [Ruminococcaceae bacterium]|nr:hypothetical protein [Oscillospiraceae bacterium]